MAIQKAFNKYLSKKRKAIIASCIVLAVFWFLPVKFCIDERISILDDSMLALLFGFSLPAIICFLLIWPRWPFIEAMNALFAAESLTKRFGKGKFDKVSRQMFHQYCRGTFNGTSFSLSRENFHLNIHYGRILYTTYYRLKRSTTASFIGTILSMPVANGTPEAAAKYTFRKCRYLSPAEEAAQLLPEEWLGRLRTISGCNVIACIENDNGSLRLNVGFKGMYASKSPANRSDIESWTRRAEDHVCTVEALLDVMKENPIVL